jgi:putative FmdB family regulatory protein
MSMPIFEYECRQCQHRFEALVRDSSAPVCPTCLGSDLERKLSLFAASSDSVRKSALSAERRRNARIHRDRAIADQEESDHHH